jgi:hypothetical protein
VNGYKCRKALEYCYTLEFAVEFRFIFPLFLA